MIKTAFILFMAWIPKGMGGSVKIVFWGNERNCGVTSNMLILASYLVWHKGYRITIFELVRENRGVKEYLPSSYAKYHKAYIETLVEKQLYYVSGENWKKRQKRRRMRNGKQYTPSILSGICYAEQNMDAVLVNLADREDDEARKIMREADLLIVNMKQSEESFEAFFAKYANLSEHIFFLIGSYFTEGNCDRDYLCSKYRILEEDIGVIPFNPELQYICEKSRLDTYIRRSDKNRISGMRYCFMREVEQTAEKIIKRR